MATKTLGTLLILIVCILIFPLGIAILGGVFGIVIGVFGAVFGAFFGILGGIFGALFGGIGWLFDGLFSWPHHFGFFHTNFCTIAVIVLLVVILSRNKMQRTK